VDATGIILTNFHERTAAHAKPAKLAYASPYEGEAALPVSWREWIMTTARKTEPKPLPTAVDPSELCRLILDELTAPLENLLGSKKKADVVKRLVETAFWNALC
jgi:hypothetical protein